MKVSMTMTEENDPPDSGSFVVHCSLEFDEESSSQSQDVDGFLHNVDSAIAACCRAVHDELQKQRQGYAVAGLRHDADGLEAEE